MFANVLRSSLWVAEVRSGSLKVRWGSEKSLRFPRGFSGTSVRVLYGLAKVRKGSRRFVNVQ